MKILALEFSAPVRSVAVSLDGRCLALVSEPFGSSTGIGLIDQALRQASLSPSAIDRLAVGLGPGSYSGVRSALAIAQGWQLARGTPVVGIGSMEVLAVTAQAEGLRGPWTLAIDAQRAEVYRSLYEITESSTRLIDPLCIVPAAELAREPQLLGPETRQWNPQGRVLAPSARALAELASERDPGPAELLVPIYLRPAAFVKAPPPRITLD